MQDVLDGSVARGDLPFVIGMTSDGFAGGAGEAAPGVAAGPDTVLRAFSMTKAVASVAALILAERGRLDLDAPVARYLPEFDRIEVLDGWDGDTPRLRAPASAATVRQLMTHTSGFAYTHWNEDMKRYRAASGLPAMASGTRAALYYPLAFDPGAAWAYGIGLDWLGLVVEAADGRTIDRFCAEEIFGPLGMASTVFVLDDALRGRLARAWRRDGTGFAPLEIAPPERPEFWGMGDALYSTMADYMRFLRIFLEDSQILSQPSRAAALGNGIGGLRVSLMRSTSARISADVDLAPGVTKSHSLIGQRFEADAPDGRRAGTSAWAGILNTHWWIDPASGRAGIVATQLLPFWDPGFVRTYDAFVRAAHGR